ncbi:hypothetical protein MRX96_043810 [Rhipicephalus microplus]
MASRCDLGGRGQITQEKKRAASAKRTPLPSRIRVVSVHRRRRSQARRMTHTGAGEPTPAIRKAYAAPGQDRWHATTVGPTSH